MIGERVSQGYKEKQKEAKQGAERGGPWSMRILREVLGPREDLVEGDIATKSRGPLINAENA